MTYDNSLDDSKAAIEMGERVYIKSCAVLSDEVFLNSKCTLPFIPFDALAKFILGEERHKLREDCFAFIHGLQELALMPFRKLASSNRKIIFAL